MASFEVKVRTLIISEHPNADSLEMANVDGYQAVVVKGDYHTGDLAVYIPEQALMPPNLIEEMGLEGRLAGAGKNRVKAIRLRQALSQGLIYRPAEWPAEWVDGTEVGEALNIIKYEPTLPIELRGQIKRGTPNGIFRSYTDIENIKKFPNAFQIGENVIMAEKLHGTCVVLAVIGGENLVSSKGIAGRYLTLEETDDNTYWRIAREFGLFDKMRFLMDVMEVDEMLLFGEGLGVQDLRYGLPKGKLGYKSFDIYTRDGFLSYDRFLELTKLAGIPTVPLIYVGPFSLEALEEATTGKSELADHIREGVVVRPYVERHEGYLGRVVLKSVSEKYLLRKGEVTEYA